MYRASSENIRTSVLGSPLQPFHMNGELKNISQSSAHEAPTRNSSSKAAVPRRKSDEHVLKAMAKAVNNFSSTPVGHFLSRVGLVNKRKNRATRTEKVQEDWGEFVNKPNYHHLDESENTEATDDLTSSSAHWLYSEINLQEFSPPRQDRAKLSLKTVVENEKHANALKLDPLDTKEEEEDLTCSLSEHLSYLNLEFQQSSPTLPTHPKLGLETVMENAKQAHILRINLIEKMHTLDRQLDTVLEQCHQVKWKLAEMEKDHDALEQLCLESSDDLLSSGEFSLDSYDSESVDEYSVGEEEQDGSDDDLDDFAEG